ncbi:MAG: hypothetical protein Q4C70_05185 [Planctomycetia bacterium]|nr:hypothetical protein [Planctomycetia bacterium]
MEEKKVVAPKMETVENNVSEQVASRRSVLRKMVAIPVLGTAATVSVLQSYEDKCLADETDKGKSGENGGNGEKKESIQGESGATRTSFTPPPRPRLKEKIPMSKIGNVNISRLILGGNLIGGWAHARDLIYVSDLVKAYHTEQKVYETFYLAEQCGINTFLGHYSLFKMVEGYWKWTSGKMQFIADCGCAPEQLLDTVKHAIDIGSVACYIQGETTDRIVREGKLDLFPKAMQIIRDAGIPCGIGAHRIDSLKAVESTGTAPDFWMKTFHHHNYWSARAESEHDNIYCRKPDETRDWMEKRKEAWIAFKVLAAGALRPEDGFRYALEGGADFLCVGMYDFQMVQNANTFCNVWNSPLNRKRKWMTPNVDRKELLRQEREAAKEESEEDEEA